MSRDVSGGGGASSGGNASSSLGGGGGACGVGCGANAATCCSWTGSDFTASAGGSTLTTSLGGSGLGSSLASCVCVGSCPIGARDEGSGSAAPTFGATIGA